MRFVALFFSGVLALGSPRRSRNRAPKVTTVLQQSDSAARRRRRQAALENRTIATQEKEEAEARVHGAANDSDFSYKDDDLLLEEGEKKGLNVEGEGKEREG